MAQSSTGASAPSVFNFQSHEVRTVVIDDAAWFVCTDVAKALGYSSPKDASGHLDDDEKGSAIFRTPGGDQKLTIINESGLYALVLRSRKPEARKFSKWVTSEVLPAIRKTGRYESGAPSSDLITKSHALRCFALASAVTTSAQAAALSQLLDCGEDTVQHGRFLVTFCNGVPKVLAVERGAHVASLSRLAEMIAEPNGILPSNAELANLAKACVDRLAARMNSSVEVRRVA